jgi:hypothetical protein
VLTYPARLSFQATWPLAVEGPGGAGGYRCAHEQDVALAVTISLSFAGQFLSQIDGVGPLGCAVALEGFDGAVSFKATHAQPGLSSSGMRQATNAQQAATASTGELRERAEAVSQRLVDPWLVAFHEFGSFWTDLLEQPATS